MVTIRARSAATGMCLLLLLGGCSREQQDWRAAEGADTIDSYGQFIQRHPDSELVSQARTRVAQLGEDRDWQHAGSADTVDAYRTFLQQHPTGKWSQEARIRVENFSLSEQSGTDAASRSVASAASGPHGAASATESSIVPGRKGAGVPPTGSALAPAAAGAGPAAGGGMTAKLDREAAGARAVPGEAAAPPGSGPGGGTIAPSESGPGGGAAAAATGAVGRGPAARAVSGEPAVAPDSASSLGAAAATSAARSASGDAGAQDGPVQPAPAPTGTAKASTNHGATGAVAPASSAGQPIYGIQLGAFSSAENANNQWHALVARLGPDLQGLQELVVPADTPQGRIYRLQAQVGPEARARAVCDSLRRQGQACVAVLPH